MSSNSSEERSVGTTDRRESAEKQLHFTAEEEELSKKLRRKVDLRILPVTVVVYLMNFIDRNAYAAARLQGLEDDLNLSNTQYQAGLAMFFVGYFIGQVPANVILNWCGRPSIYIALATCGWGAVSGLTALVKDFAALATCRFILGIVEAPFFPGVMFALSKWYTKEELNLRMAIFFTGNLISGAFGNLLAAGILGGIGHARGISPWQWLYIIEGALTVVIGILVLFLMPDFPETWRALSGEERYIATKRITTDALATDVDEPGIRGQLRGVKMALQDTSTYVMALAYTCIVGAGGFQNFFPSMTETLGYSKTISLLLCAPPYIFVTMWLLVHSWLSDKLHNRFWFMFYPIPIAIVGFVVFMVTINHGVQYFGMFLMMGGAASSMTAFSWVASSLPRPPAKRAAAMAIANSLASTPSIWTPFLYFGPRYTLAMGVNIGLAAVAGLLAVVQRSVLVRRNRQLARFEDSSVELGEKELAQLQKMAEVERIDVGAARRMHEGFRYPL